LLGRLDEGIDDCAIADNAKRKGLGVQALSRWYLSSSTKRGLLLSFTNVSNKTQAMALAGRLAQTFAG